MTLLTLDHRPGLVALDDRRSAASRWALRLLSAIGLVIIGVGCFVAYRYSTHPGQLTTDPEFTDLRSTVAGNTLTSPADPAIRLTFDERYSYVGGQKFVLYGTADTEQHFFVEEYPDGSLKSVYWIQFEAFLPDNDYTYDYSASPLRERLGDFSFFVDAEPGTRPPIRLEWPGTDGALARHYLADRGYRWPDEFAYARLVHLPPEGARRQEVLVIFLDDLAPTGLTGSRLRPGGDAEDRWPEIQRAHLDKVAQTMAPSHP